MSDIAELRRRFVLDKHEFEPLLDRLEQLEAENAKLREQVRMEAELCGNVTKLEQYEKALWEITDLAGKALSSREDLTPALILIAKWSREALAQAEHDDETMP